MRYYFNSIDGNAYRDEDGVELANLDEARLEALKLIADLAGDSPMEVWRDGQLRVEVTDRHGLIHLQLALVAITAPVASRAFRTDRER